MYVINTYLYIYTYNVVHIDIKLELIGTDVNFVLNSYQIVSNLIHTWNVSAEDAANM